MSRLDPEQDRHASRGTPAPGIPGPVFVRWFGLFFVIVAVGVFIWGWQVAGGVRRLASETDNSMRTVAWNLLRWSAGHDGAFPRSEEEFLDGMRKAIEPPAPSAIASGAETAWPVDEKTALLGHPAATLHDALRRVKVQWPPRKDVAPEILSDGKPTLPGTVDDVRGWLRSWVDQQRRASAPPLVAPNPPVNEDAAPSARSPKAPKPK